MLTNNADTLQHLYNADGSLPWDLTSSLEQLLIIKLRYLGVRCRSHNVKLAFPIQRKPKLLHNLRKEELPHMYTFCRCHNATLASHCIRHRHSSATCNYPAPSCRDRKNTKILSANPESLLAHTSRAPVLYPLLPQAFRDGKVGSSLRPIFLGRHHIRSDPLPVQQQSPTSKAS